MGDKGWLGVDLIFDLDADHIVRGPYDVMLARVKEELFKLIDMLTSELGFFERDLRINFSGGRGYHIHIPTLAVRSWDSTERRELVNYVSGTGLSAESMLAGPARNKGWQKRYRAALLAELDRIAALESDAQAEYLTGFKGISDKFATGFLKNLDATRTTAATIPQQLLEHKVIRAIPNPENKEAMDAIRGAVLNNKADLGLIFDTDVDRMSAVFSDGQEVNRDALIAMMAAILVKDYPNSTIVTDSVTSDKLTAFLEGELQLKHHRFQRGYKNVINECKRLNEEGVVSPLAIETSGHGALKENYYLDDGAYMAVKLLIAAAKTKAEGKTLNSLIEKLEPQFETAEYRLKLKGEDFKAYGAKVLETFTARAKEKGYHIVTPNYEGVRISFKGEGNG